MGLDMYLYKKTYVRNWGSKDDDICNIELKRNGNDVKINHKKVRYIIEEAGYWRKVNQIHQWFVENVQFGVDDCKPYYVSSVDLEKLLNVCKLVRDNNSLAEQLLPTQSGFFFGSYEYDDWYFEGINDTIKILEECLEDGNTADYEYEASW